MERKTEFVTSHSAKIIDLFPHAQTYTEHAKSVGGKLKFNKDGGSHLEIGTDRITTWLRKRLFGLDF